MDLSRFGSALAERRVQLKYELDDERRRQRAGQLSDSERPRSGGGGGGYAGGRFGQQSRASAPAQARALRPTAVRYAAMSKGSQSAVVKLASYGGGARAGAMIAYVSRQGELRMENERGEALNSAGDVARVQSEWEPLMDNRAFSKDIAGFSMQIKGAFAGLDDAQLREIGRISLHGLLTSRIEDGEDRHSFAFGVGRQGEDAAMLTGLMVLRSGEGQRRTPDAKGEAMLARRIGETKGTLASEIESFRFTGSGNGVEYGSFKLRELAAKFDGKVTTDRARTIENAKQAGDLVQRHWRGQLHSRAPRDVMHLIMSAKAGTDAPAFEATVRGFLAEQFAEQGHRYVFALHDPASDPKTVESGGQRPHIHAHAIITTRSDYGDRARITPATFRTWRENMAEHARAQGINMEMTDRRDIASAPAYSRNQVRPVSRQGRTEHEGTSRAGHARYIAKREGIRVNACSERSQTYRVEATQAWGTLALSGDRQIAQFATSQIGQIGGLETGGARVAGLSQQHEKSPAFIQHMVVLDRFISVETIMADGSRSEIGTRSEFELYEKSVNAAIFQAEREITDSAERDALGDFTSAIREVVAARRELVETALALNAHGGLRERGVDVDAAYRRHDEAVAKHGEAAVDAGMPLLQNLNRARDAWIEAGGPDAFEHPATTIYRSETIAVVQTARAGNSFLGEIVQGNDELRDADADITTAEREAETSPQKSDRAAAGEARDAKATSGPSSSSTGGNMQASADLQYRLDDQPQTGDDNETHERHEQQWRADNAAKVANRGRYEPQGRPTADPANQQILRQQELQRQQRERDDDDRDR